MTPLISPAELKRKLPPDPFLGDARATASSILRGEDPRIAILVGPCSIHDPEAAIEYAKRLRELANEVKDEFFLIMRLFFEKARSSHGWKGLLYDPHLDGSDDIEAGIVLSRELLLKISSLGVPCAMELLNPLAVYYFDDSVTWGLIGARTVSSQPHRGLASSLSFPVGFKNETGGTLESAILGVLSGRRAHSQLGLSPDGRVAKIGSQGNPLTHLVLRGSDRGANYDPDSIQQALALLRKFHLEPRIAIDCSHGNSGKDPQRQKLAFHSVIEQIRQGNRAIRAIMLESHLFSGKQSLAEDPTELAYGVSITDACLSWEETVDLLSPTSINCVQN